MRIKPLRIRTETTFGKEFRASAIYKTLELERQPTWICHDKEREAAGQQQVQERRLDPPHIAASAPEQLVFCPGGVL